MKLKVLAVLPGIIPSTILGVIKPMISLKQQGKINFKVQLSITCTKKHIADADLVIFSRNCEVKDYRFLFWAKQLNKKIIYELDDNFFAINVNSPIGQFHRHPINLYVLKCFLENANLVRVYSNPLFDIVSQYNNHTKKHQAYFDFSLIKSNQSNSESNTKIKIAYATGLGQSDYLSTIFAKAVAQILDKYQDQVELYTWGIIPQELSGKKNIHKLSFEKNYDKFIEMFANLKIDIGLAPLQDDIFHRSKTNNKFREYAACKIAGIYSKVDVYADCIQHGETGLLVENTQEEWYKALELLIEDKQLRLAIQDKAFLYVNKTYSMDVYLENWLQDIFRVMKHENTKRTHNLESIRVLIGYDDSTEYRLQPLKNIISIWQIHSLIVRNQDLILQNINEYDVVISFKQKIDLDIKNYLDNIEEFDKPLIIDLLKPDKLDIEYLTTKYSNITHILSDQESNFKENYIYTLNKTKMIINGYYPFIFNEDNDVIKKLKFIQQWSKEQKQDEFLKEEVIDEFTQIVDEFKKENLEDYYSLNNPQAIWCEILGSFDFSYDISNTSSYLEYRIINFGKSIPNKIKWIFVKIIQIIKRIIKKIFLIFKFKISHFIKTQFTILKINLFKKYN